MKTISALHFFYYYFILFLFFNFLFICRCLWIWSALEAKLLSIIVQVDPIVCAQWRPDVSESDSKEKGKEGKGEKKIEEKRDEVAEGGREGGGEIELGIKEGKGDMEGKDTNDCSNSSSSSYFTSTSPLLAYCTGTGRLYFWSKKEGKVEGDIKWSDTVSPSPSSTSFDTSVNSLTAPGNLSSSTSNQKTMSTYYICI